MIRLTDICPGECVEHIGDHFCKCGLPWWSVIDEWGFPLPHTTRGLVLTRDVYSRILAREGNAIDVEERREADREAIRARRRLVIGGGR